MFRKTALISDGIYNGGSGYVSAAYLSDTAPTAKDGKKDTSDITFTATATTVYASDGTPITIYKSNNGDWYDGYGMKYTWVDGANLKNEEGTSFTTSKPGSGTAPAAPASGQSTPSYSFTAYWENGNGETLTQYSDGSIYSSSGVRYYATGGGAYAGSDGTTLYNSQPQLGTAGSDLQHGLSSQGSGRPVEISSNDGGAYYDASGVQYFPSDDGTWVDENGDYFNEDW